ncbi:hypothetical protein [Streptomyces sp. EAG2]|nr:hypothetical protein [Streptomyces sp. EAG2]
MLFESGIMLGTLTAVALILFFHHLPSPVSARRTSRGQRALSNFQQQQAR